VRRDVFLRDIGVENLPDGKPYLRLTGGAAEQLARLMPAHHEANVHLTLTDEYPYAQAFVIVEAVAVAVT